MEHPDVSRDTESLLWRHYPWLIGLLLAPLLYGSATPEGQCIVGLLLATSLLLLSREIGRGVHPAAPALLRWLGLFLLLLPIIPLPAGLVGLVDGERLVLARRFPVELAENPA
jgi:hypothetical protein